MSNVAPHPANAPQTGAAELVAALDRLEHAARACALATNRWRDAATALDDEAARAVAVAPAARRQGRRGGV